MLTRLKSRKRARNELLYHIYWQGRPADIPTLWSDVNSRQAVQPLWPCTWSMSKSSHSAGKHRAGNLKSATICALSSVKARFVSTRCCLPPAMPARLWWMSAKPRVRASSHTSSNWAAESWRGPSAARPKRLLFRKASMLISLSSGRAFMTSTKEISMGVIAAPLAFAETLRPSQAVSCICLLFSSVSKAMTFKKNVASVNFTNALWTLSMPTWLSKQCRSSTRSAKFLRKGPRKAGSSHHRKKSQPSSEPETWSSWRKLKHVVSLCTNDHMDKTDNESRWVDHASTNTKQTQKN